MILDEAAQHLTKRVTPKYPGLAEMARIQGNVILEIGIDPSGAPKDLQVISGHPMLVDAALNAVRQSVYRPFEIGGKPSEIRTFVVVQFGTPYPRRDLASRADVLTLMGRASLSAGDLGTAEQYLNKASEVLTAAKDDESWAREQWLSVKGRLDISQKRYSEAERYLKQSLELAQRRVPQSPTVAEAQGWLAQLYILENNYDLARAYGDQEIQTCRKNFKRVGPDANLKQKLGTEIAYRSWMLTLLALQQNDHVEAAKRCQSVMDYQQYLGTSYHDQALATCQKELNPPAQ